MTITVLIADDQPLMRSAMHTCIAGEPDLTVVGEAPDGAAACRLAEKLHPDVVVIPHLQRHLCGAADET